MTSDHGVPGVLPEVQEQVRQEVARQVAGLKPANQQEFKAEDWDFKVERIEQFPGHGWVVHQILGPDQGAAVYVVWRMNRVLQAQLGVPAAVPIVATKK